MKKKKKEKNYFDKPRYEFWLEPTAVFADSFEEAYEAIHNQLYFGMCGMYYKVTDFHGKELHPKTNIRILTVQGVNNFLIKDEKKKIKLYSKSTGEEIT